MKAIVKSAITLSLVIAITALPALANHLTSATATDSCTSFTLSVTGADLNTNKGSVSFAVRLTPTSGTPINIKDKFGVARTDGAGDFAGSITANWSKYGVTLNGTYKLSGTAHLNTEYGNRIPIVFTPTTLNCTIVVGSCQPSSSLAVLAQGKNVTSYVPNAAWDTSFTGLSVVPIEGSGTSATIATPNPANSCASDPLTGETVCTSNVNDVYLITGSTLNTTIS